MKTQPLRGEQCHGKCCIDQPGVSGINHVGWSLYLPLKVGAVFECIRVAGMGMSYLSFQMHFPSFTLLCV